MTDEFKFIELAKSRTPPKTKTRRRSPEKPYDRNFGSLSMWWQVNMERFRNKRFKLKFAYFGLVRNFPEIICFVLGWSVALG